MARLQRIDPRSFDRFAADYDRFASLAKPAHMPWLIDLLPERGRRAVDLGCGSGRLTVALAERFDRVIGIDISEPLIAIARLKRSRPNVEYRVEDLRSFQDAEGFDLIFSSTTLHHVPDLTAALTHVRGLVRPEGQIVLIDNTAPRPTVPRWRPVAGAVRRFPVDVLRLGRRDAAWALKFQISRPWLDHLASDRFLNRKEFERIYSAVFTGGQFFRLGYLHALLWTRGTSALLGSES
jgi:ubiquinone/menaquinone biosynthesis C-methylase UbiE